MIINEVYLRYYDLKNTYVYFTALRAVRNRVRFKKYVFYTFQKFCGSESGVSLYPLVFLKM